MAFLPPPAELSPSPRFACSRRFNPSASLTLDKRQRPCPVNRMTRRALLRALGAFSALSVAAHAPAVDFTTVLRRARVELDRVDAMIDAAKWDSIRTILASAAVRGAQEAARAAAAAAGPDSRGAWVGLREDALSAAKLLDAAVYANVFVGEERQVLGTKIDYDTPREYLRELKGTLDELVMLTEE